MNIAAQINRAHYLFRANSFKTVDSLSELINQNLHLTKDKNIALLNKPPGFILSNKGKDNNGFIPILSQNIKEKLNWSSVLRIPIVTDDQAGIFMFTSNKETFDLAKKTMKEMFPSQHLPFLKFYGITSFIPAIKQSRQILNLRYENIHNDLLNFEVLEPSIKGLKSNKVITYQIEHNVVDYNKDLNVALVRFSTSWHNGDGILFYAMKNLFPILGDHRYSPRVKTILGKPVLLANQRDQKPSPQILSRHVQQCLQINEYIREIVPLHLQLYEINLEKKFKKQKVIFKQSVPLQDYFKKTLENFYLNIPNEELNKT